MSCVAVIPARRAERTILGTLESLRLGNAPFVERVLVVTSELDPTAGVVRDWIGSDPRVELVLSPCDRTAGAARNDGRRAAGDAALLLFVDADASLEAGGAAMLAAELERSRAGAITCRIVADTPSPARWTSRVRHMLEFKEAASRRAAPAAWLPPTTVMLCRAGAFDRAGGFADLWPGEDLVFAQTLRRLGLGVERTVAVSARHRHPHGVVEMLRHQHRLGRTAAVARRTVAMHGSVFTTSRFLAPALFPARLARLYAWQLGEGAGALAAAIVLLPFLAAGLAAWTAGFMRGIGEEPVPAGEPRRPATTGSERASSARDANAAASSVACASPASSGTIA